MCEVGGIPQLKTSKKDKKFTVLGLTCLSGEPLMCVIIIQGVRPKDNTTIGIDLFKKMEKKGKVDDPVFFVSNS